MKILVSSGLGRLHFNKIASLLKRYSNNNVTFITGSIPNRFLVKIIFNTIGKFVYGYRPSIERISKRIPEGFIKKEVVSLHIPDLILFFLLFLSKLKMCSVNKAYSISYYIFGLISSFYIKKFDLLYVRAGAGSKVIDYAKKLNKTIIVDYSSAHPNDILNSLKQSKSISALNIFNQRKRLWSMAIEDVLKSDYIVVNSSYVKDSLVRNGILENKIFINNMPINLKLIPNKKNYNFSDKINIVYSGRFISWKGCDTLLKAIDELSKVHKNIKLNIFGSIESDYYQNNIFKSLKKKNLLIEHGVISQKSLFEKLTEMDIYVFLSYSEGSAQSVKEAMAAGLPVICSKDSGAPIIHKKNGLICDVNTEACCNAISSLINSLNDRSKLGISAREEIKNNHNEKNFINTFEKIISENNES
ncbi:glycosyltransferase family 4 protein [Pelagibacterales bacterium SAG-MED22]|nr:glycosyltransferase family 4 protein [Pelagibacterales bacterium SAG-MED22]